MQPLIVQTTIEFLDAELRHDATAAEWMKTKLAATIGTAGVVETK